MSLRIGLALLAVLAAVAAGCGKKEAVVREPEAAAERADPAVDPPSGWVTHENLRAGFTIALPRSWEAQGSAAGSRVTSRDGSLVASLQADRSEDGRTTPAAEYSLATIEALPGYRDLAARRAAVPGSPYEVARAAGTGRREDSDRRQHVSVTALRRPGFVTYVAVAFSSPRSHAERRTLHRALATLRGRPAP